AAFCRVVGVHEFFAVLGDLAGPDGVGVLCCCDFFAEDHVGCAFSAHHRDLVGGPGQGDVGSDGEGVHDDVGAAVGLPHDDLDAGHCRVAVGVEEFGAVPDDASVLLSGARHEPGNVHEGDEGDVEGVAELDEPCRFLAGVDVEHAGEVGRLLATTPTTCPSSLARAHTMLGAHASWTSKKSPS